MKTTRLIPACKTSLLHSLQGERVRYKVASFALWVDFATFRIAFASACKTYHCVFPVSSSQQFGNPDGVPLYPSEMIILSRTIKAPTCFLLQCESFPHSKAILR